MVKGRHLVVVYMGIVVFLFVEWRRTTQSYTKSNTGFIVAVHCTYLHMLCLVAIVDCTRVGTAIASFQE